MTHSRTFETVVPGRSCNEPFCHWLSPATAAVAASRARCRSCLCAVGYRLYGAPSPGALPSVFLSLFFLLASELPPSSDSFVLTSHWAIPHEEASGTSAKSFRRASVALTWLCLFAFFVSFRRASASVTFAMPISILNAILPLVADDFSLLLVAGGGDLPRVWLMGFCF